MITLQGWRDDEGTGKKPSSGQGMNIQGWRDDKGTGQKPTGGQKVSLQGWRDDENPFDLFKNYGPTTAFARLPRSQQQTSLGAYSPPRPKQNTGERRQGQASPAFGAYQQPGGLPAVPPTRTAQAPARQFTMPQMDTNTRDAFIYNINNSLMRQQAEGLGTQAPRPPQFDFQSLYNNAQQMAADGWRNPLAGLFR